MVDQFLIPKDENEFKWLNENMSAVTSLYDGHRQIAAESQKRLFSPNRDQKKNHSALMLKDQIKSRGKT
jgi:hypothetical protein